MWAPLAYYDHCADTQGSLVKPQLPDECLNFRLNDSDSTKATNAALWGALVTSCRIFLITNIITEGTKCTGLGLGALKFYWNRPESVRHQQCGIIAREG